MLNQQLNINYMSNHGFINTWLKYEYVTLNEGVTKISKEITENVFF